MSKTTSQLDPAFVESQKRKLLQLQSELSAANRERDLETSDATQAQSGQAREYEEDAQHLTELELSGQLGESVDRRLGAIGRALAKIAEGTYGISDISGKAIDQERLKALPEAVTTKDEQQSRDSA